jgi:hypothetical protein
MRDKDNNVGITLLTTLRRSHLDGSSQIGRIALNVNAVAGAVMLCVALEELSASAET